MSPLRADPDPNDCAGRADELLRVLLAPRRRSGSVSIAAVRAVHDAFDVQMDRVATIASRHGATLDGGSVEVATAARPARHAPEEHERLAVALRAGSSDPGRVLAELGRHAALAGPDVVDRCVPDAVDAALARAPRSALVELRAAVDDLTDDAPGRTRLQLLVAGIAADVGEDTASELLEDVAAAWPGTPDGARLHYRASWIADADVAREHRRQIEEFGERSGGWDWRVRGLEHADGGDEEASLRLDRGAMLEAIDGGDDELAAASALSIANRLAIKGELHQAIDLLQLGARMATRARAWRTAVICHTNRMWMLVDALDLGAARAVADEVATLVDSRGLLAYRSHAFLHAAGVAVLAGDLERARTLVEDAVGRTGAPGSDADSGAAYDETHRALRVAEFQVASGDPGAAAAVARAKDLVERAGFEEHDVELGLVQAQVGSLEQRAAARLKIAAHVGTNEALLDAQAICLLARHVALDGADDSIALLEDACGRVDASTAPVTGLAIEEATVVLAAAAGAPRAAERLVAVAERWRAAGFPVDAALVDAAAARALARDGAGERAAVRFDAAHRELARLGAVHELHRVRAARQAAAGETSTRSDRRDGHSVDLLDLLPESARRSVEALAIRRVVAADAPFPTDVVTTLVSGVGVLELDAGADERRTAIELLGPGASIGVERVAEPAAGVMHATALGPCTVDVVPLDALAILAARDPDVAIAVARHAAARAARLATLLHRRSGLDLDARVAAVVDDVATAVGTTATSAGSLVDRRIPRALLGALAGATREATTRSLARQVADGVLATQGHRIVVRDRGELRRRAGATSSMS